VGIITKSNLNSSPKNPTDTSLSFFRSSCIPISVDLLELTKSITTSIDLWTTIIIYQEGVNDDDDDEEEEHLVAYRLEGSRFVECS
jgi:hypothetical protein